MSNMKNGFSTLNRWLGKKNKEKSPAPSSGKLSKSITNLSISTTNISDASQLEYNRIAPLPAITSNAPFEQTFRITVLLPKDQLYVARLGARVPLSKLLELACDHKSLDPEKYEFRNSVDPSQIYNCDLTIGAVGLSEIRLCHKSDSYDSFNADEVMKLHRTSLIRDSLSSSEFSSRNSKHTTKTASPYSSSNSLNSMDSTGMNYTRTPVSPPPVLPKSTAPPPKLAAPPRKKRAAPRPPSQIVIPERSALVIEQQTAEQTEKTIETLKNQQEAMSATTIRKDYYLSTPNLSSTADSNGNEEVEMNGNNPSTITLTNGNTIEYSESEYAQVIKKNARNLHSGSVQNLTSGTTSTTDVSKLPEPSPRKRSVVVPKKKAAPAPPPRSSSVGGAYGDDTISIASTTTLSTYVTPNTADSEKSLEFNGRSSCLEKGETGAVPTPLLREATPTTTQAMTSSTPVSETCAKDLKVNEAPANVPKPVPRQTTTTLLNATPAAAEATIMQTSFNVSKVLLNRSPTPEPRSLVSESSETTETQLVAQLEHQSAANENDDNISKHADSGIGEPVPSPLPDSLPSEGSTHECKSTFESSSDDDEIIKTYNFKLGKTTVKNTDVEPAPLHQLEQNQTLTLAGDSAELTSSPTVSNENQAGKGTTRETWNFSIAISPPPNFADVSANQQGDQQSTDAPITPKILERPVLNFDNLSATDTSKVEAVEPSSSAVETAVETPLEKCPRTPLPSPSSPINEIIDELSTILSENRVDTLIKRSHDEQSEIQSAKPNTLTNFTISTLTTQHSTVTIKTETQRSDETVASISKTPESVADEEKLYKKRLTGGSNGSNGGFRQLNTVTRADSFHATSLVNGNNHTTVTDSANGLNSRSASYLSLSKLEQNGVLNRRRSSSELSIGESPSLQSLEVIKTILNSRKNSLANSSDGESKTTSNIEVANGERSEVIKPQTVESKKLETKTTETTTKPKEIPKAYRYSGPPSINFSTWSERPKVQVAIKNEGDYIFGGKNAATQNAAAVTHADVELRSAPIVPRQQQQRATMHLIHNEGPKSYPPVVAPKPTKLTTTDRMGIPDKEYHVPLMVKPLRDVTVTDSKNEMRTTTTHRSAESNISKIMLNSDATNKRQITPIVSNTSTLPRVCHNSNRFSTPIEPSSGINILRSTSVTPMEKRHSMQNDTTMTAQTTAPFGQNTLRRTGLKEKILAKEEEAAQNQQTHAAPQHPSKPTAIGNGSIYIGPTFLKTRNIHTAEAANSATLSKPTKALQSVKLELKLQEPTYSSQYLRVATPKSAPAAVIPAVPPMPTFKSGVTLRSQSAASAATTPTEGGDQRDELLEAIRNFKRTELNRV